MGFSILDKSEQGDYPSPVPVAGGFNQNGTFYFSHLTITNNSFVVGHDWDGTGDYYIVLSTSLDTTGATGDQYFYTDGEGIIDIPAIQAGIEAGTITDLNSLDFQNYINYKTYTFTTEKNIPLDWSKFSKIPKTQDDFDEIKTAVIAALAPNCKILTVTGIPSEVEIAGAYIMDADSLTQVAGGFKINGNFVFFDLSDWDDESGTLPTTGWNGEGDYLIWLSPPPSLDDDETDGEEIYIYTNGAELMNYDALLEAVQEAMEEDENFDLEAFLEDEDFNPLPFINLVKYTFTAAKTVTINFDKFKKSPTNDEIIATLQEMME